MSDITGNHRSGAKYVGQDTKNSQLFHVLVASQLYMFFTSLLHVQQQRAGLLTNLTVFQASIFYLEPLI